MQNEKCKMQNEATSVGAVIGRPREGSGYVARAICPSVEANHVGAVIGRPPEAYAAAVRMKRRVPRHTVLHLLLPRRDGTLPSIPPQAEDE